MKILKLPKDKLDLFASVVQQFGELHAPVEQDGMYVFKRLTRWSDARLEYDRTILPPKKYFLPPRETLFRYRPGEGFVPNTDGLNQRIILFGVHACDVYAINILDRVFAGKYNDPYYQARRKNIAIIGIDCTARQTLLLPLHAGGFRGSRLRPVLLRYWRLLPGAGGHGAGRRYGAGHRQICSSRWMQPISTITSGARGTSAARFSWTWRSATCLRSSRWSTRARSGEELGEKCLSCGSCSMVCPTCYCYDVADDVELGSRAGKRTRSWDSCLFDNHALVASGENFRGPRASRIKFRFYHKQRGFVAEYGRPSCVGCGRCISGLSGQHRRGTGDRPAAEGARCC